MASGRILSHERTSASVDVPTAISQWSRVGEKHKHGKKKHKHRDRDRDTGIVAASRRGAE
mgnify:CR=1 FL=1